MSTYRHAAHLDHDAPTTWRARLATLAVGAALLVALGLAGASDLDTACQTADPATSSACR